MKDSDARLGDPTRTNDLLDFRASRLFRRGRNALAVAALAAVVNLACETPVAFASLAAGVEKEHTVPKQVYGGDAKDAQKLKSIGVGLRMGMRFSVSVAQGSELNRKVALALKDHEDKLNACYMHGIEGDTYAPGSVTTLQFRFTLDERASRIVSLARAPNEKGNTALAVCVGRVIRRLLVPVPRDIQVSLKMQFSHKYVRSVASN